MSSSLGCNDDETNFDETDETNFDVTTFFTLDWEVRGEVRGEVREGVREEVGVAAAVGVVDVAGVEGAEGRWR